MRLLSTVEQERIALLTKHAVSLTLIEPTATGLKKSIMDATGLVRGYLKEKGVHDYALQGQGSSHKIIVTSLIYTSSDINQSKASLYRPNTKKGDPRIWFSKLNHYANPNDILALICFDKKIHLLNLTQLPLKLLLNSPNNPVKTLIRAISQFENAVANELLSLLKNIARQGLIPARVNADTAVGRTLERLLHIPINSSKQPDYKGIELKAFRTRRNNRKNLFTQVPNWKLSKFKSSAEILDAFGYWRDTNFKLYCTVSTSSHNSQGLILKVDKDTQHLIENSQQKAIGDFAIWTLEKLHQRLLEKHRETFWIAAKSVVKNGIEHFQYLAVEHTRKPILSQFDVLLEQGTITLDHLIKRNAKGAVKEKGPSFKIKSNGLSLLFPPSKKYKLLE